MIKEAGGVFRPVNDMEYEKTVKFKTGEQYSVEIKLARNPAFHRKVFAFFNFCFEYWKGDNEFQSESKQFDIFRQHLTCLAGFYDQYSNIHGEVRIEAKSLAFSSMNQEEFEECYNALIRAALKHLFPGADVGIENQLMNFF
jgi:hypothetical protein